MNKLRIFLIISTLTILGGYIRFWDITKNPVSLTVDEVAIGYNAYSILKTGKDEYGNFMPISFRSVGDYKNPVPIYLMTPSIYFFGLNEFSVRLPTAVMATLFIPVLYLFVVKLTKNQKLGIISAFLITISPWHIYYSRYASDNQMAAFFVVMGIIFYLKLTDKKLIWAFLSAFFLTLSMYTYHPQRLFIPLLVLILFWFDIKIVSRNRRSLFVFLATCLLLSSPLIIGIFSGQDATRANMVFITKDIEFNRNELLIDEGLSTSLSKYFLLPLFWARKYLNYFTPSFLFYSGLNMNEPGVYGMGVLYFFDLILLILGMLSIFKNKNKYENKLLIAWILVGILPASLTNNEQHAGRTLLILPAIVIILAKGFLGILNRVGNIKKYIINYSVTFVLVIFTIWNLTQYFLFYTIHFPVQRGEDFMWGTKEVVLYALENKDKYKEIVFDPRRGIKAPFIVSIPHMYILFYSSYDPLKYQNEEKRTGSEYFGFDKFTIRKIDWAKDRNNKDVLYIGSPWSFPESQLIESEILKKVYIGHNDLALMVVTPGK